ncbi:hypothetical protein N7490_000363 [Penicillium lividum]|nr:hypothetical protein N7490_000363 [Penicillium lividum]
MGSQDQQPPEGYTQRITKLTSNNLIVRCGLPRLTHQLTSRLMFGTSALGPCVCCRDETLDLEYV